MTQPPLYAGFWIRTLAMLIDSVWTFIVCIPFLYFFFNKIADSSLSALEAQVLELSVNLGITALLVMLFWLWVSATPGKMLLNIEIVDARTHGPITKTQILVRYLAYYLNIIPLFLGFLWVAKDKQKRGFHDLLANTVVIISPKKIILE